MTVWWWWRRPKNITLEKQNKKYSFLFFSLSSYLIFLSLIHRERKDGRIIECWRAGFPWRSLSILFFLFALVFFFFYFFHQFSSVSQTNEPKPDHDNFNHHEKTTLSASGSITHVYYELLDYRAVAVVASFVPDGWIFENDFHAYVYSLEQSAVTGRWCLVIRVSFVCRDTDFLSFVFSFFFSSPSNVSAKVDETRGDTFAQTIGSKREMSF